MNVGQLRKALEGLPDDIELISQFGTAGQKDVVYTDLCTHENGGMHYSTEAMETSIKATGLILNAGMSLIAPPSRSSHETLDQRTTLPERTSLGQLFLLTHMRGSNYVQLAEPVCHFWQVLES
jgi:hypothetical protein